jgi:hypothetical protein
MKRSDGCDWLDLQVDRTVWMSGALIWCGAVHRKLGTPDDWRNGIKSWNISRAEMCRDIFGIFYIVFNKNQYLTCMKK